VHHPVNFFGHALVAHRSHLGDEAVLGAMLPDFAGMAGMRLLSAQGDLRQGVDHHHETDRRFHAHPTFVGLCAAGIDSLTARGVARGPARASCHVGVELLLDGALSGDDEARDRYRSALRCALDPGLAAALQFREQDGSRTLGLLAERLLGAPLPEAYADPGRVAERLTRLLSHRPRLALDAHGAREVGVWLREVQPEVAAGASELLRDLLDPGWQP
jgi:hypothetical protein